MSGGGTTKQIVDEDSRTQTAQLQQQAQSLYEQQQQYLRQLQQKQQAEQKRQLEQQKQVTESGPASFQLPYILKAFGTAQQRLDTPKFYYPGQTYAGFNPYQVTGQQMVVDSALSQLPGLSSDTLSSAQRILQGAVDPTSDPYLKGSISAALRPVEESLLERILPSVRSGAVHAGQFGSDRQGLVEGTAIRDYLRQASDISSQMTNQARAQNLQATSQLYNVLPQVQQSILAPGTTLSAVGQVQQDLTQKGIDERMARYAYERDVRDQQLKDFYSIIGTPLGTSTTQTGQKATDTAGLIDTLLGTQQQQTMDRSQLSQLMSLMSGVSDKQARTTSTTEKEGNPWNTVLGLALLAASFYTGGATAPAAAAMLAGGGSLTV